MALSSYVLPVLSSTVLMVVAFTLGRLQFSMLWVVFFAAISFVKDKLWKHRQKRVMALQAVARMEKEMVVAQLKTNLQDLPTWVQFPDTERAEWINKLILQLWPYIADFTKRFVKEQIEPQVKANLPSPFRSFTFESMDMGDIPLRLSGIKVFTENVGRDKIVMDMDIAYAGDCEFVVSVGGFKAGLNNLQMKGKMRWIMKPLVADPPLIGGVHAFFLDTPIIDFNLTGLGEFVELPGLFSAVKAVVNTQVANICVIPNTIILPLIAGCDDVRLRLPEPDGVVRINLVEARNLMNKDISFIVKKGKSDPYARTSVGAQTFRSRTVKDDLNPVWNEYYEAVVDHASGQLITMEVYDDDGPGMCDEFLGKITIDLSVVRRTGVIDQWFQLEGAKHGDVHLKIYWLALSTDAKDFHRQLLDHDVQRSELSTCLLLAYVDCIKDLAGPRVDLEPSPYVEAQLGTHVQRSLAKAKTSNPAYNQKFLFFVTTPDTQMLKISAKQDTSNRLLGEVEIPVVLLKNEEHLELYQHTFQLSLGAHTSPIVMTLRLRYLNYVAAAPPVGVPLDQSGPPAAFSVDSRGSTKTVIRTSSFGNALALSEKDHKSHDVSPSRSRVSSVGRKEGNERHHKQKLSGVELTVGNLGRIRLSFAYSHERHKLAVGVICAENLVSLNKEGTANVYAKLHLIFNNKEIQEKKTPILTSTLNPVWEQTFEFDVMASELMDHKLTIVVKDNSNYGLFSSKPILGQIIYPLREFDPLRPVSDWFLLGPPGYAGTGFVSPSETIMPRPSPNGQNVSNGVS